MPSKKLWGYVAKLEKAIKEVMESSPEIAALVEKIQGEGVEVSLNCIALFSDLKGRSFTSPSGKITREGGKRRAATPEEPAAVPTRGKKKATRKRAKDAVAPGSAGALDLSDKDREFLRSIGIRFD
ncbi:MAG: hypothetical protein ACRELB_25535 [Polyangiaceae bacterium]